MANTSGRPGFTIAVTAGIVGVAALGLYLAYNPRGGRQRTPSTSQIKSDGGNSRLPREDSVPNEATLRMEPLYSPPPPTSAADTYTRKANRKRDHQQAADAGKGDLSTRQPPMPGIPPGKSSLAKPVPVKPDPVKPTPLEQPNVPSFAEAVSGQDHETAKVDESKGSFANIVADNPVDDSKDTVIPKKQLCHVMFVANSLCAPDELVAVVGNCPELGEWDLKKAPTLQRHPSKLDRFVAPIDIERTSKRIEYKYAIVRDANKLVRWEGIPGNRKLETAHDSITVNDLLDVNDPPMTMTAPKAQKNRAVKA